MTGSDVLRVMFDPVEDLGPGNSRLFYLGWGTRSDLS
jgi:hypothetical protein